MRDKFLPSAPRGRNRVLLGILILSLALVCGVMAWNFKNSYQTARSDVLELSKNSSERNAENIEMFFLRHEDILLASATSLEYALSQEGIELSEVEGLLRDISEAYNDEIYEKATGRKFTGIYAAINGALVHGMRSSSELDEGYDPLDRPWYKEGKAGNGRIVFGEPYWDAYDKRAMVMTATKLLKDGTTVIGMDIPLSDLQSLVGAMDISVVVNGENYSHGYGFVVTENGIVMAHSNDPAEQWKDYGSPNSPMYPIFEAVKHHADEALCFEEIEFKGLDYSLFSQRLSNGWYAITLTGIQDIRTSISNFTFRTLTVTAVVTLFAFLYCLLITRAYMKSEKLTDTLQNTLDLVKTDALTGLLNRAAYDIRVKELQSEQQAQRDASFALLMMDLNDLKYINDHYGHAEGDRYICNCCDLVRKIFPCEIYRIGGDEFALFLTGELFDQWEAFYDRMKQAVANANSCLTPTPDAPSIAIGLAIHTDGGSDSLDDLLRKADAEMYTNKLAVKQMRLENSEKAASSKEGAASL